ncbi:major facilitator superfamily domain-containing protein [Fomes fomentarius]|nr:major facilitator superfamily domain-containing protein [Fomes fomentarius]
MPSVLHETLFVLSVCGVTILNIFVNGALIIALPTLGKALDFTEAELQWPLNVYALSYGSLLLLFGRVADVVGSKRMFLFGTGFFAIWSIATGIAPNKVSLIVFVALTGVGAAANTPTGKSLSLSLNPRPECTRCLHPRAQLFAPAHCIFSNHFEPGPTKNRAIAALGAGSAIGYIVGLVGGGFLCQTQALWRVIFYIQGALAAVFFVMGVITIPPDGERARYKKGIDWIGAILSVAGVGLLTFVLSESSAVPKGWKTPWVPALLVVSLVIIGLFVAWESYRERRDMSVIMPVSLWTKPGKKMSPMIGVVFLSWCGELQRSQLLRHALLPTNPGDDPVHTSLETLPFAIMSGVASVGAGFLVARMRGILLIGIGHIGTLAAPLIFALIDIHSSYWAMAFPIMLTIAWTDIAYTVGNLHVSIVFDADSQALAGSIFNVATRLGTSISLALSSSVATAVSNGYAAKHPELGYVVGAGNNAETPGGKEVLMVGFRAAGWVSFAFAAASLLVCVFGLRGIGVVGQKFHAEGPGEAALSADTLQGVVVGKEDKVAGDVEKSSAGGESALPSLGPTPDQSQLNVAVTANATVVQAAVNVAA